jgi:DinB superfamily
MPADAIVRGFYSRAQPATAIFAKNRTSRTGYNRLALQCAVGRQLRRAKIDAHPNEETYKMSTKIAKTDSPHDTSMRLLPRILREGYGPGAWHGADLKAALADVGTELAFWRPQPERHNIAEIALHHAFFSRTVRARLLGSTPERFPLDGEDWFPADGPTPMTRDQILALVETEQERLAGAVGDLAAGRKASPLSEDERVEVVLGITCHAVYHAGQIQLIKRLRESAAS